MTIRKTIINAFSFMTVVIVFFQNCSDVGGFKIETHNSRLIYEENGTVDPIDSPNALDDISSEEQDLSGRDSEMDSTTCKTVSSNVTIEEFPLSHSGFMTKFETGTISPGTVKAYSFVANRAVFSKGILISIVEGYNSGAYNSKDISVSKCPGDFEETPAICMKKRHVVDRINVDFQDSNNISKRCAIMRDGATYYFNIRPGQHGLDAAAVVYPAY